MLYLGWETLTKHPATVIVNIQGTNASLLFLRWWVSVCVQHIYHTKKLLRQAGAELCQALNSNCLCVCMFVSVLSLFKKTPLWVLGCS